MPDSHASDSGSSFTRAFLPGLILGLVVGGLAGAFLPDWMGGPKLEHSKVPYEGPYTPREGEGPRESAEEDLHGLIEEAQQEAGDAADAVGDAVKDGAEKVEDAAKKTGEAVKDAVDDATGEKP